MTDHLDLRPHKVVREDRADGSILLRSGYEMSAVDRCTGVWLDRWAARTPDAEFLAERSGEGWYTVSYVDALNRVRDLAAGLLARGVDGPILILSGNSVDHALLTLAAQYVGLVTVPVAAQYSLIPAARGRLKYVRDLVKPALVYAADDDAFGPALDVFECPKLVSRVVSGRAAALDGLTGSADVAAAHAGVGPATVTKLLLTSGSTSDPKAVVTTHGMITTNQAQIRDGLPFVSARPPVLVDWLPWNHVFGGSHNFNLVLANGGTLYIDDGAPIPAKFARTVENLGLVSGTISFNVPIGFAQLVAAMERDATLRETYFRNLDMIFYAGASLPQGTWNILERMAMDSAGRMPLITSSWGLTETAPAALLQHVPAKGAGIVGVPMTGVTVKLVDDGTGRMDVRVKGDNVFSGYHDAPGKTEETFDDEGFFITGDAMRFVDPDDMGKGLRFDGRLSEDFKLSTGIWVQAAQIRLEMLALLGPLAQDLVICGAGRDEVGMLVVPGPDAVDGAADNGALCCAASCDIRSRMFSRSETTSGSARVVARALVLSEPPDIGAGEVTAKGNLNFAKLLERRAHLVDRLYDDNDPASIVL
ncbi:feruloyl-CoA synthase [Tateyamaria omphalii]|uniref:AMP-binding protein n=1 Tax=Tateyamaria omphalii TaxID=299262 RepID=UPI001677F3A9|nr:AMP-binding protein [Tateyamaria omphalii]GGX43934.1 feruloyl-CoA synthase [Tateyamaria omphalii]